MNNNEPLISVIIAIYNPGKYLRACLDSIVNQTYKNLEIILVDDGSTDDSLALCNEYAAKDNRIIVHHKENSGVSATRNQGIRLAHGDYFSFIDSDDFIELDTYEYLMELIKNHNVDIVTHEHFITKPSNETTHTCPDSVYGKFDRKDGMNIIVHHFPFACNKLFSKKCIENLWFNETICRGEDGLFCRFAFDRADSVYFDKRPLYHYVQSEDSAVRGNFRTSQLTAVNLIPIYDSFFSEKYPELYDYAMSNMLHLMTTLYFDMRSDRANYSKEQKNIVREFRALFPKVNLNGTSKNNKTLCKAFHKSPIFFYISKKFRMLIWRLRRGK
ncbi:MAG: glycosyltransferase family 2 protein [Ruminococcaceae bacterium]|nr:glycosyltransferase family 2 protein [Oscillospiraceae bacterium]